MTRQEANEQFQLTSFLDGANAAYIEQLQARYETDPASVSAEWQAFFKALADRPEDVVKAAKGASWKKNNWPIAANGDIVNPFSVICHSAGPAGAGDETPRKPDLIPGQACEHCNLCGTAPPPEPAAVLIDNLLPTRLLQVLRPASHAPSAGVAFRPNLARGPPRFA